MKKILSSILFTVVVLGFTACLSGSVEFSGMSFNANDGNVPSQYYSETTLDIVPNYDDRTIETSYTLAFPNRTEGPLEAEVGQVPLETSGTFGGEYFDRFEELSKFVYEYEAPEEKDTYLDENPGAAIFTVNVTDVGGKVYEIATYWEKGLKDENIADLQALYLDLIRLLTEEEQV